MPLFETIVIGRVSKSSASANLMRAVSIAVLNEGGNVRDITVLGDRVLARNVIGKDHKRHIVGRYMQVVYDGNHDCRKKAEEAIEESYETLRYSTHRMKDYFSEAQLYKKALKNQNLIVDERIRKREYVTELINIFNETESSKKAKETLESLKEEDLDKLVWRHSKEN